MEFRCSNRRKQCLPQEPNPASALEIAKRLEVEPAACLYVGDSGVDMKTAAAAGMFPVGVVWGFRDREELEGNGAQVIIKTPLELLRLLNGYPRSELG